MRCEHSFGVNITVHTINPNNDKRFGKNVNVDDIGFQTLPNTHSPLLYFYKFESKYNVHNVHTHPHTNNDGGSGCDIIKIKRSHKCSQRSHLEKIHDHD